MRGIVLSAAAAVAVVAGSANAQTLIAYWNFNNSTAGTTGGLGTLNDAYPWAANSGSGTITTNFPINTVAGTVTANTGDIGTFGGSTINALFGDVSGGGLAMRAGTGAQGSPVINGRFIEFNISTASIVSDLVLTYASQRTSTGFTDQVIEFSTNGGSSYSAVTTINPPSAYLLQTVNFGAAAVYGFADLRVRITFNGATNPGGNNRIDNVQFNGVIPAPGALALLGLGGLVAARRRR